MIRKHSDLDREKAQIARFEKQLTYQPVYPNAREAGFIIKYVNGELLVVELKPGGRCDQHRAVFVDGFEVVAGMAEIDQEIRYRMPPRLSEYNL